MDRRLSTTRKDALDISMRGAAECKGSGRDVSLSPLLDASVMLVCFVLVVECLFVVGFCLLRLHLGFLHSICLGPIDFFLFHHRRLDGC